jgi:hypothetical protein
MKRLVLSFFVCSCVLFILAAPALASPALPVTKPPLRPVPSYTGPTQDPNAIQGQWFKDVVTNGESYRPYEFYDNKVGYGGSASKSTRAIEGYVQNIVYDGQGKITSFGIRATITNDDSDINGTWDEGGNSHGESTDPRSPYNCNMYQVKLAVSFADDGTQGNLPVGGVYLPEQNIYAMGYDELAWYCWTPGNPDGSKTPWGGYMVPTYDFGNIMHDLSVTRDLSFGLYAPEASDSQLALFLEAAHANDWDVFLNRTTSLKISDYVDNLVRDDGTPYPVPPLSSSDVSVFFPEPATLILLAIGGLALRRRK